ncbi:MAG: hypothetical protein GY952_11220 [Rhodobacteraceae bacterium]|nr:hypothetical protein [Paracoccaceae bacterium]
MSNTLPKSGLTGSVVALASSFCCVMPMVLMLAGLGGSWMAVFGKIAMISPWLTGLAAVLLSLSWVMILRNGAPARIRWMVATGSLLTLIAIVIILREAALNDYLITLM